MNKKFMADFYDKMYEDPVIEVMGTDEQYQMIRKKIGIFEQTVYKNLKNEPEVKNLVEELLNAIYEMEQMINKRLYLKGAEDREKML